MPNKAIYNALNCRRLLNMYQMINDFGCMVQYHVVDMFVRFKDKMHYRKVSMVWYIGKYLIRPFVTHFMECRFSNDRL